MLVPQCWLAAVHEVLQLLHMQHLQLIKHIPIRASNPSKGVMVGGGSSRRLWLRPVLGAFSQGSPRDTAHLPGCSPFSLSVPPTPR